MMTKLYGYLAAFAGIVIAILAALGMARRAGKKEEQAVETEKALKQAKESDEIDSKVRALPQSELDKRLRVDQRD